jgi:hypothetical protein
MAKRDLTTRIYTDDDGNQYAIKIDASVAGQIGVSTNEKVGGSDYTGDPELPAMPVNLKPRHVVVVNAGDFRRVICLELGSELFTGVESTIDLQQLGSAALTYTRHRKNHEEWKRRGSPGD